MPTSKSHTSACICWTDLCSNACFGVNICAYFGFPVITCISVCILSSSADYKHVCVCVHRSRWRINSVKYDLQEPNMLACLCLWK